MNYWFGSLQIYSGMWNWHFFTFPHHPSYPLHYQLTTLLLLCLQYQPSTSTFYHLQPCTTIAPPLSPPSPPPCTLPRTSPLHQHLTTLSLLPLQYRFVNLHPATTSSFSLLLFHLYHRRPFHLLLLHPTVRSPHSLQYHSFNLQHVSTTPPPLYHLASLLPLLRPSTLYSSTHQSSPPPAPNPFSTIPPVPPNQPPPFHHYSTSTTTRSFRPFFTPSTLHPARRVEALFCADREETLPSPACVTSWLG